jgi:hypothetical protein
MRRWVFIGCLLLFAPCACTRVIVSKQPGYDFPPTDPSSILVHDRLAPNYPFIIIGRISLDATWTEKPSKDEKKIKKMAAQAGADGILVSGFDIDIGAFNQYVASRGYATVSGTDLSDFAAAIRPRPVHLERTLIYGYLMKRSKTDSVR